MNDMHPYFHENESIAGRTGGSDERVLETVANRFIGAHPKQPPVYRLHSKRGFGRGADYRYDMNLEACWPELRQGQFVYVWGKIWSDADASGPFSISCYAPAKVFVGGEQAFASNLNDDVFPERRIHFRASLRKGWNDLVLEFVKTGTGCGGKFGTGSVKGSPLHVLVPVPERAGQEGWSYSAPQDRPWTPEELPRSDRPLAETQAGSEASRRQDGPDSPRVWYPEQAWTPQELAAGRFGRVIGATEPRAKAFAWTKLVNDDPETALVELQGIHQGRTSVFLDGVQVHEADSPSGSLRLRLMVPFGAHDLVLRSERTDEEWGFELLAETDRFEADDGPDEAPAVRFADPYPVEGLPEPWLYLGPFPPDGGPDASDVARADTLFGDGEERTYWRADLPDTWVRPYLENAMYGKWNYPLGVTLYGILRTGVTVSEPHYKNYAADHIEQCTALHEYALWDAAQYGAPGTNHQLAMIDSLDDCGSFGASMLEAHRIRPLRGAEAAAAHIARYISQKQDRLPDGALYRTRGTTDFMTDTMWCDDLYMSTPFLAKYYRLTGEPAYLDDAAEQFLLYRKRLFMPDRQIMHHVYDFKHDKPNGVPWGRGNGWVLFSLTELLAIMPDSHRLRPQILAFFRELCEGYLRLQGANGLWHQVLTDPESYEEASCTSMFVYAFARGVRFGWLERPQPYVRAALRGWNGLKARCIDKHGNVYGVCRGSGYSFSPHYYKDELTWQLNDTHGIGIVLLAGIETIRLREHLSGAEAEPANASL